MALVCGVMATAALPPVHLLPLLVPAFSGLVWLSDGSRHERRSWCAAFGAGWWFGLGHFVTGLYWISNALLFDRAQFDGAARDGGLPALLALFPAAATLLAHATRATGAARILFFAVAWTAMEWLRGHALTGFPWNLIGYAWAASSAMSQLAAVTGIWGLSLLTVLVAAAPAVLLEAATSIRERRRGAALVTLLSLVWAGGALRLHLAPAPGAQETTVAGVRLRLVQANSPQSLKWRPEQAEAILHKYLRLSVGSGSDRVTTHVIWPEAAVPFALAEDPSRLAAVASVAPSSGLVITGADRTALPGRRRLQAYNSLMAVDTLGRIVGTYDKHHLVPFGEYVPLRGLLNIAKVTHGRIDFSTGSGAQTLSLPGLPPVSPLICYEAIFPDEVVAPGSRPGWLLNVTNDGWFGTSAGPHQHFESARMRAVEQGLPLARVAVTGISAVVDPYGRVLERLGLGQEGTLEAALPSPLPEPTLYARFGDRVALTLLFMTSCLAMIFSKVPSGRPWRPCKPAPLRGAAAASRQLIRLRWSGRVRAHARL